MRGLKHIEAAYRIQGVQFNSLNLTLQDCVRNSWRMTAYATKGLYAIVL